MRHVAVRRLVGLVLVAALAAGCAATASPSPSASAASGPSFVLHVLNIDGPKVGIVLGEQVVATVPCGGGTDLHAGQDALPALPWAVQVRNAATGKVLGSASFPAFSSGDASIQIRGGQVMISSSPMSGGPSADPNACASAGASPSG